MKKMVFKKWLNDTLMGIGALAFMLIATTIESDWTKEYFIFVGINIAVMVVVALLLHKWGRPYEEEEI